MQNWDINTVRLPLNEFCWLGINGATFGGSQYRTAIINYVNLLSTNNIYAILTLAVAGPGSGSPTVTASMPNSDHSLTFWYNVSQTFASYNNVIFDLYDQPTPDSNAINSTAGWQCWLYGGTYCPGTYTGYVGMQALVTAVRTYAIHNIIMVSGINGGNSLDQWVKYVPTDSHHNLAAGFQVTSSSFCNAADCWTQTVQPLYTVPYTVIWVTYDQIAGTCECQISCTVADWGDGLGDDGNNMIGGYWDTSVSCASGSLISDYGGTPSADYGSQYQQTLLSSPLS